MCGSEAAAARSMLDISYPVVNGIIRNWEDMNYLWDYTFNDELKIDPTQYKILLTEAAMNPLQNRKRMVQVMFGSALATSASSTRTTTSSSRDGTRT